MPAFAEETEPDVCVITENADITEDISDDTDATVETVETAVTEDSGDISEDIAEQSDTDITEEISDEENPGEAVADDVSEESTEDAEPVQPEEQAETDAQDDTTDEPAEDNEELLEEEQELNTSLPAWVKSWDSSTGTLTLQGQQPNTGYEKDLAYYADIAHNAIQKIVITSGTKAGTSTAYMFYDLENLSAIEGLKNLDTSDVTNMSGMFWNCYSLTSLDLSSLDTSKVEDMGDMFYNCEALNTITFFVISVCICFTFIRCEFSINPFIDGAKRL